MGEAVSPASAPVSVPLPALLQLKSSLQTASVTNLSTSNSCARNDGKALPSSLRKIAEVVKLKFEEYRMKIEAYRKRLGFSHKRGVENRYDELLKDANELAKEIDAASSEHDLLMEQPQKVDIKSAEEAIQLTEFIQIRTHLFDSLWRMDHVIDEINDTDAAMPYRHAHSGLAPTARLIPIASRIQEDIVPTSISYIHDDEEANDAVKKPSGMGKILKEEDELALMN